MRRTAVHLLALITCVSGLGTTLPASAATGADGPPEAPPASTSATAEAPGRVHVTVTEARDPAEGTLVRVDATGGGRAVLDLRDSGALTVLPSGPLAVALEDGKGSVRVPFDVTGGRIGSLEVTARVLDEGRELGTGSSTLWVKQGTAGLEQSVASPLDVQVDSAAADARAAGAGEDQVEDTVAALIRREATVRTSSQVTALDDAPEFVSVSGTARYEDRNGVLHPIREADIAVYDAYASNDVPVDVGTTGRDGSYSLSVPPNLYEEHSVYVEVRARTDHAAVVLPYFLGIDNAFAIYSDPVEDVPDGADVDIDLVGEESEEPGRAFAVLDALVSGAEYLEEDLGEDAGFIEVDFPTSDSNNNYDDGQLHIQLSNFDNWDLLLHEYGHYVADRFDIEDNPGGPHFFSDNLSETGGRDKDEGTHMAWAEGWPTYFGISLQQELDVAAMNLPSAGDTSYDDIGDTPADYDLESNGSYEGEDNEVAVQRFLWDMYDDTSEYGDDVSWSDSSIWYDVSSSNSERLSHAVQAMLPADTSPGFADGPNCLLTEQGMAPDLDFSSVTVTGVASDEPPQVEWEPGGGGPAYRNDRFVVRFYDAAWEPLLESGDVSGTSWTPSRQEWDQVARGHGAQVRVAVTGWQGDDPQTGPYTSCSSELEIDGAVDQRESCTEVSLPPNDDGSSQSVALPFAPNFFGTTYTHTYVNNNGNVTFDSPMSTFTPFRLDASTPPIIAPFFADVDTRGEGSAPVTYSVGETTFGGRQAFCVNWLNVGYYSGHYDKLNSFQLLLVDRSDLGVGDFDIVFNYDGIQWETGDASGGSGGLGGTSAGAGFSAGTNDEAAFFELPGSLQNGAFLDGGPRSLAAGSRNSTEPGRYVFPVRNGIPPSGAARITGEVTATPGLLEVPVSDASVQVCPAEGGRCVYLGRTGSDGTYDANGLPPGAYDVSVYPPADVVARPQHVRDVTLAAGERLRLDVELEELGGLPDGASLEPSQPGSDGVLVAYWQDELALTTAACPGGSGSYEVFQDGASLLVGDLTEVSAGRYRGTIPPFHPVHGYVTVVVHVDCPEGTDDMTFSFDVYIDPSGLVRTPSGRPVAGATVTLFRSDDPNGPFTVVPDGSAIMSPANRTNPSLTDDRGHFGWDVITGYYRVRAEKEGCTAVDGAAYVESRVMEIPPPVTDLDLRLLCSEPPVLTVADATLEGNTTGGWAGPITGVTATDPDGGEVELVNDAPALLPLGETSVTWTATDEDGEQATATQVVTVADTTAPIITCPPDVRGVVGEDVAQVPAQAVDVVDPAPVVSATWPERFGPGTSVVVHRAVDGSGNASQCRQSVTLSYDFDGFLPPFPQRQDSVRAGSALPMKWKLRDAAGNLVVDRATFVGLEVDGAGADVRALELSPEGTYQVVVKTPRSWAGTTRRFVLVLADGSRHEVGARFR
ncbi:nidogen-like domain-containing protein [Nocardioides euryhalodurans]|uniref:nidogen-like domain-containing protein n=1 Tax=Nocardioides euryhalodurans TaxID=2518370 RepID=UPI00141DEF2C|nr:nidogen-like domain-containing protein [Nocardioides euryhalodurans]